MVERSSARRWFAPATGNIGAGASAVFSGPQRLALLAAFTLLVVLRLPQAWVHGRFLDEEATVFLAYAWHRPWHEALFRPFAGYWNLGATATTLIAARLVSSGLVSLEHAPYITMTMALAVQLLPAVLILTGRAAWLASRWAAIAALLMIATMPTTEEVFFNVLHIQFQLALAATLILALDRPASRAAQVGYAAILFVAPLCGPGAIVILPLFALRALVDRDPRRWEQAAALAAGAAVQLLLFYGASPLRGHILDPATIAAMMAVRLVALPLLNFGVASRVGGALYRSQMAGDISWWIAAAIAAALFAGLVAATVRRRDAAPWLALAGLAIALVSYGFGMVVVYRADLFDVSAGERYDFLPLVLIGLSLIALAGRLRSPARLVPAGLILLMLLNAAIRYPIPLAGFDAGPSWPAEVAAWRRDHRHPLAVWPRPWAADLSDGSGACAPPRRDMTRSDAPRFCEGGWAASFFRPAR